MVRAMLPVFVHQQSRAMLPTLRRSSGRRRVTRRTL
jgi:hypothetical protein